jgi:LAO/AO transport system kinase
MGKDYVLVETVGVGQDEIEIVRAAHTTLIVMVPGMGDDIQAIKAGILEAGDIFVINKAEREGVQKTCQDLQMMIEMNQDQKLKGGWKPTIFLSEASKNEGIEELMKGIEDHRTFLYQNESKHLLKFKYNRAQMVLFDLVKQDLASAIIGHLSKTGQWKEFIEELVQKKTDPYTLSERILSQFLVE